MLALLVPARAVEAGVVEATAYYDSAIAAFNGRDYAAADALATKAVGEAPFLWEAWQMIAYARVAMDDLPGARKALIAASNINPNNPHLQQSLENLGSATVIAPAVEVRVRRVLTRAIIDVVNHSPDITFHGVISFPTMVNFTPDVSVPTPFTVLPSCTATVNTIRQADLYKHAMYEIASRAAMGDPRALPTPGFAYLFPWRHGKIHRVVQGYFGATTHLNKRALDFDLPEGSSVCAARAGIVIEVKDDSSRGGPARTFLGDANGITILHDDGTWAIYGHLQRHGARVKVCDQVAGGQVIGLSGHTGWATGPHLHFAVYQPTDQVEAGEDGDFGESIATEFLQPGGRTVAPREGWSYCAVHPGKRL